MKPGVAAAAALIVAASSACAHAPAAPASIHPFRRAAVATSTTVDPQALRALVDAARAAHSDALVVVHDGQLLVDETFGTDREPLETMSMTKSIAALAIGFLMREGRITSLDVPLARFFPGAPDWDEPPRSTITLRHLLTHSTGLAAEAHTGLVYQAPDVVRLALLADVVGQPGVDFVYNNQATNLLAGVVEAAAGEPLHDYLAARLFAPLGITEWAWTKDPLGHAHGMSGLALTALDLARIGQLMLDRGTWDGRALLDPAWVDEATQGGRDPFPFIGLLWWRVPRDALPTLGFEARGFLGQALLVLPAQRLIVVRLRRFGHGDRDDAAASMPDLAERARAVVVTPAR